MKKKGIILACLILFMFVSVAVVLKVMGYYWYILWLVPTVSIILKLKASVWLPFIGIVATAIVVLGFPQVTPLLMSCIALLFVFVLYSLERRDFIRLKKEHKTILGIQDIKFLPRALLADYPFIEDAIIIRLGQAAKSLETVSSCSAAGINKRDDNIFSAWATKVIKSGGISTFSDRTIRDKADVIWLMVPIIVGAPIGVLAIKGIKRKVLKHLKMFQNLADVLPSAILAK